MALSNQSCMAGVGPSPMIEAHPARPGSPKATRNEPPPPLSLVGMRVGWGFLNIERAAASEMWEGRAGPNDVGWGRRSGIQSLRLTSQARILVDFVVAEPWVHPAECER